MSYNKLVADPLNGICNTQFVIYVICLVPRSIEIWDSTSKGSWRVVEATREEMCVCSVHGYIPSTKTRAWHVVDAEYLLDA